MSLIPSITLNERDLTRAPFSSQENEVYVQIDSEKFPKIQIICGKNAENFGA